MALDYLVDKKGNFIMICSKCGAQCNENQAFCLKCGNPIQLMADFNLIEKELASSIDEFMTEMENEKVELPEESEEMKTIDVPVEEINMGLKMVDINRGKHNTSDTMSDDFFEDADDDFMDEDEITPVYVPEKKTDKRKKNSKKSNKKMYIIIGCVVAAIAVIALILVLVLGGDDNDGDDENIVKDFAYYYSSADTSYKEGDFDNALSMALSAVDNAGSDEDKIKARKLVNLIYEGQNFTGEYYIQNLEELFYLGENSKENGVILLNYYVEQKDAVRLLKIFNVVDEETVKETLGDNLVEKPTANIPSGQYNNVATFELSATEGSTIYYTISDGSEETVEYIKYTGEVEIYQVGQYKVRTFAVNEQGIPSYIAEFDYTIVEGESAGPVVTPEAGTYTEPTQIVIQVPEGSKAYYTYDGTEPTENSEEYTEPVNMIPDVNTFKAIVVDKYGNISDVTSIQYNLRIPRNETIPSGEDKVWDYYYNNGLIDINGNQADGSVLTVTYNTVVTIDNYEYYIYDVIATSIDGTTTTGITYCAVNTYDGKVTVGLIQAGEEFILPELETSAE